MASKNNTPVAGVPWSIFQQGGGQGAAKTWAEDALREIGAPLTVANEQFIYDWEVSEGGGGWYNPLNQGPDPSNASLTSTGQQYGGGAANYKSYAAGLQGFKDYLNMPAYAGIKDNLRSKDPVAARDALISSPWASSHYGGGSAFSDAPLPGHKSALKGTAGSLDRVQTTSFFSGVKGASALLTDLGSSDFWERVGLVIGGFLFIIIGLVILALPAATGAISQVASTKRAISSIGSSGGSSSGGPTEEEKEDRNRRLELAERNAAVGESKAQTQLLRERRLSLGQKHKGGSEPNPNPQHS